MRPVKAHKPGGRRTAERLAEVCAVLGPVGKKLPLAWLADLAEVPRSTLKNAASRDSLSYDVAWQIAGLFDDDRAATVEWLRKGTRRAPARPKMDSVGSSETQSAGPITQRPNRAERLAGIAPRAFSLVARAADPPAEGGWTEARPRQLRDALLAFAS